MLGRFIFTADSLIDFPHSRYAIKIAKKKEGLGEYENIGLLMELKHKFIVTFHGHYFKGEECHIIMDFCPVSFQLI